LWAVLADARAMAEPVFAPLQPVLAGPERGLSAWALAGEVAAAFEKYQAWRRGWLLRWDAGADRDDWQAVFIGDGESLGDMKALAAELGIADRVEFAGWRYDDDIRAILSTCDVCLAPDPPSPLNDVSTMIKIPEYMALGRAVASYALPESRAGGAGLASGAYAASYFRVVYGLAEKDGQLLFTDALAGDAVGGAAAASGFVFCTIAIASNRRSRP